jgi:hypothetical protein
VRKVLVGETWRNIDAQCSIGSAEFEGKPKTLAWTCGFVGY